MSDSILTSTSAAPTEQQVTDYLRKNKNYFSSHPDLLSEIELPHRNGNTISLVEKQVAVLRERNIDMRDRLNNLLDNARENDRLFDKTKRLVLALLEARDLPVAIDALLNSFSKDFNIHYTRIILFTEQPEASRAVMKSLASARTELGRHLKAGRTTSGNVDLSEAQYLFDDDAGHIGSCAVTILNADTPFGILAIGNQDPSYYHATMGTLFLSYIGEVLNRVLPKLM
ncbi:MAG: hypothetical protein COA42_02240 [Alteromonadaceae bacterium]|nr:MAG: hypothetical protein COA42_02240 [Alteromonadaceae bacterium]